MIIPKGVTLTGVVRKMRKIKDLNQKAKSKNEEMSYEKRKYNLRKNFRFLFKYN